MIASETVADEPSSVDRPWEGTALLVDTLRTESRLLSNLAQVLRQQRSGVASDDLQSVDDSVYSAQRILLTLSEARRRRRSLMQLMGGAGDTDLDDLERALGPLMDEGVAEARSALKAAARELSAELDINRRVLQSAIRTGETYVKALYGASSEGVYTPQADTPKTGQPGSGLLLNRQV